MYDKPISATSISPHTFAVHAMQTGLLTQTYGVYSGTISLTPTYPFHPGELVQVSATTGTLNLVDGIGPDHPSVWQFWIGVDSGLGRFADSGQSLGGAESYDVALGDLDGDGDLDAFVTNANYPYGQANTVWLNDGGIQGGTPGAFTNSGQSLGNAVSFGVALGDLDGDGDLDAFVTNAQWLTGQANEVWQNDGTGTFTQTQSLGNEESFDVALGDVDGDGDLDAFVANSGANEVWLNDGNGNFADYAERHGIPTALHFAGSPIAFMANLHCAAAIPSLVALEHHGLDLPFWSNLVTGLADPLLEDGYATVPEKPGLGVDLNYEGIKACLREFSGLFEPTDEWNTPKLGFWQPDRYWDK